MFYKIYIVVVSTEWFRVTNVLVSGSYSWMDAWAEHQRSRWNRMVIAEAK